MQFAVKGGERRAIISGTLSSSGLKGQGWALDLDGDGVADSSGSAGALDADLTAIGDLSPANDDLIQRKAGAWTNRTVAQIKSDLGVTGTNTGDQTSIVGITGTKAQFDTAVSDGNILYVGDVTQYTDEAAQDAVGAMVADTATIDFTYADATPALTADVKDGSVTYAKLQDVSATSRVLGRITAGSGDAEELTGANVRTVAGLATSDSPQFAGLDVNVGAASSTSRVRVTSTGAASGNRALALRGSGDTEDHFYVDFDGVLKFGSGSATPDTDLFRSSTNTLKTNSDLEVAGVLYTYVRINSYTGTSHTIGWGDLCRLCKLDNAAAITTTVPANATTGLPIGFWTDLVQWGAGQVTVAPEGGVTILADPGLKLLGQGSTAQLVKMDTNAWLLRGRLSA